MPQVAYNYQTYLDLFRRMISGGTASTTDGRYSDHYVAVLLDEALDRIQERMRWIHLTHNVATVSVTGAELTTGFTLASGQYFYLHLFHQSSNEVPGIINYPAVLGTSITGIRLLKSDGTFGDSLTRIPYHQMLKDYPDPVGVTAGTPTVWAYLENVPIGDSVVLAQNASLDNFPNDPANSLMIMPPPDWTKTNGIVVSYHGRGFPLERIWNPGSTVTAEYEAGAAGVALSASYFGKLRVGDEFGIVRVTNESPRVWYRITNTVYTAAEGETPAVYGLYLDNHIVEDDDTDAQFIVSQVADLERAQPGRMGFSPVWLAIASEIAMSNPELSVQLENKAWAWLNQLVPDQDMQPVAGPATWNTPFFNSSR